MLFLSVDMTVCVFSFYSIIMIYYIDFHMDFKINFHMLTKLAFVR